MPRILIYLLMGFGYLLVVGLIGVFVGRFIRHGKGGVG
jgi:hypothetical protein